MALEPKTIILHAYYPNTKELFEFFNDKSELNPMMKAIDFLNDGQRKDAKEQDVQGSGYQILVAFGTYSSPFDLKEKEKLTKAFKDYFGPNINFVLSYSNGLICSEEDDDGVRRALELENNKFTCLSGIMLPKNHVAKFQKFDITKRVVEDFKEKGLLALKELLGLRMDMDFKKLKGVLLLIESGQERDVLPSFRELIREGPKIIMAGGSVPTLLSDESDDVVASGLLIFGEETNVQVRCGLIRGENEAQLRDEMKQIKSDLISPACTSFGVILKCQSRGQEMFGSPGVESTFLQAALPETKLVGTIVHGRFARMEGGPLITQTDNMSLYFICSYVV